MTNTAIDTDVLIVGAGPVGLFLANECARRGLRFRIIDVEYETKFLSAEPQKDSVSVTLDHKGEPATLRASFVVFTDIVELRMRASHDIALVRPDGYIAYSASSREGNEALTSMRSLLERQTKPQGTRAA